LFTTTELECSPLPIIISILVRIDSAPSFDSIVKSPYFYTIKTRKRCVALRCDAHGMRGKREQRTEPRLTVVGCRHVRCDCRLTSYTLPSLHMPACTPARLSLRLIKTRWRHGQRHVDWLVKLRMRCECLRMIPNSVVIAYRKRKNSFISDATPRHH
jgi:hypothetical protein